MREGKEVEKILYVEMVKKAKAEMATMTTRSEIRSTETEQGGHDGNQKCWKKTYASHVVKSLIV